MLVIVIVSTRLRALRARAAASARSPSARRRAAAGAAASRGGTKKAQASPAMARGAGMSTGPACGLGRGAQYAPPAGELAPTAAAPARATAFRSQVLPNPVYSGGLFGSRITHGVRVSMAATPPAMSLSTYHVVSTSGRHER